MPLRALIYDAAGNLLMTVLPDNAKQLDDPAFNPVGCKQIRTTGDSNDLKTLEMEVKTKVAADDPIALKIDEKYAGKK